MEIQNKVILTGAVFILILISGFILSKIGKPYNLGVFTIHKLISLAALIFTIVISIQIFEAAEVHNLIYYIIPIIMLLSLGALITGAILSAKDDVKQIILTYHRIASFIILIAAIILIVLPLTS